MVSRLLAWRPLQSWQTVLAGAVSVLLAAVLTVVLTDKDLASAQTYVTAATHADITLADGRRQVARIGSVVPRGASVMTGRLGGARLTTGGRDVYVGALSTLRVVDGLHQVLDQGLVMIDARSGPALTLATSKGAGTISAEEGALARVEQNLGTLRLAVYDGHSAITADGRRATTDVPALRQVRVPYGGVPEPRTALALTITEGAYDAWEQRLVANLVQADIDLNSFAAGLNGVDGLYVLNAAPASLRESAFAGRSRGEQALAVAVAQKGRLHRDASANLAEVERDRGDGGSWGVVAAIVRAPVTDVTSVLGSSLDDPSGPALLAGGPAPTSTPGRPTSIGDPTGSTPQPTGAPTKRPTDGPTTTPPTTSSPVEEAIKRVTDAVPTATPTPTSTPLPTVPTTSTGPLAGIVDSLLNPLLP
jgi:hypothetical protein